MVIHSLQNMALRTYIRVRAMSNLSYLICRSLERGPTAWQGGHGE
jgi:hypothetical protein